MVKKRVTISVPLLLLLLFTDVIYKKYYKIDFGAFHSIQFIAAADSPDNKHSIGVTAYKKDVDADEVYLRVVLYDLKTDGHTQDGKIIMWDRVQASKIESRRQGTDVIKYSVHVEWKTPESILINERIIDINKGYDYRRD